MSINFFNSYPLKQGALLSKDGVLFSIFSRNATYVELYLFDKDDDLKPIQNFILDNKHNKIGDIWHIFVKGIKEGQLYLYKIDGEFNPLKGAKFNKHKYIIDPYAKALTKIPDLNCIDNCLSYDKNLSSEDRDLTISKEDNIRGIQKCIVINDEFDWEGDRPLNYPIQDIIIYEAHVKGLTFGKGTDGKIKNVKIEHKGTYKGIIELIPYLKELGITSLELLPVQEFHRYEYYSNKNPITQENLYNYWGYSTMAFFAPSVYYAHDAKDTVNEFKSMVKALHKAGIEIILDIVFNHTAEGNEYGPTFSFKGIDNSIYYILDKEKRYYMNFSGCGNTLNCNHPIVRNFILDCLKYWVVSMHVDGFRFDLASILGRDESGHVIENSPTIREIIEDPLLRDTKLIVEPWDAGGAYQVGSFPGDRWCEWNDKFRDNTKSFWIYDKNFKGKKATRIAGSSDLYFGKKPFHSINFISAHDGFTLNDLVSYNSKHNYANGENNRDGHNYNISYNYGYEGITDEEEINFIRKRQMKNMLCSLLLSVGTPMLLHGDEFARTQKGNNNAYCQDSEISWLDYNYIEKNNDLFEFTKNLIAFRKKHPALKRPDFFTGKDNVGNTFKDITWFNNFSGPEIWDDENNVLSFLIDGSEIAREEDDNHFYIIMNATEKDKYFLLPPSPSSDKWFEMINTNKNTDKNFDENKALSFIPSYKYLVNKKSVVLFMSKTKI